MLSGGPKPQPLIADGFFTAAAGVATLIAATRTSTVRGLIAAWIGGLIIFIFVGVEFYSLG